MSIRKIISKYSKNSSTLVNLSSIESPVGKLTAAADNNYLYIVAFEDSKNYDKYFDFLSKELSCKYLEEDNKIILRFEDELSEYFRGKLKKFTVPLKTFGSDFQKTVWDKLLELPYGSTQSYGDLAKSLGRPASHSRAVGAACGANPMVLVVPCHRLVAASGIGGFSCGVSRKEKLIQLEKKYA